MDVHAFQAGMSAPKCFLFRRFELKLLTLDVHPNDQNACSISVRDVLKTCSLGYSFVPEFEVSFVVLDGCGAPSISVKGGLLEGITRESHGFNFCKHN